MYFPQYKFLLRACVCMRVWACMHTRMCVWCGVVCVCVCVCVCSVCVRACTIIIHAYTLSPLCFHAINGSGPTYLFELLHIYTPSRTLCSSSDSRMLKIQQYKRKTHGIRTFTYFGPYVWNSLPQDIRQCSTLTSFKTNLQTFLFSQYFRSS